MPKELRDYQRGGHKLYTIGDSEYVDSATEALDRYGFKRIGSGNFSDVYENSKYPWMLKVFHHDTAYMHWLKFCKQNQNNRYVPKIKGSVIRVIPHSETYAIRLEKLLPITHSEFNEFMDYLKSSIPYVDEKMREHIPVDEEYSDDLFDIAEFIYYNMETGEYVRDLWVNNVMKRSDGQIVIIDPIA